MNRYPPPLSVPQTWSPEQALAVWDLLNELADQVWAQYEEPLAELLRNEGRDPEREPSNQLGLFNEPNDPLPF